MSQPVALMLRRVLRGRWFMLYGSFLIMSAAGTSSVFAVYSRGIKQALGYSQEQLNTVGFFMDLGANVGVHAGLVAGAAPMWVVLSVGAAMNLGGYLMLYLSVVGGTSSRPPPPLWLVCLYILAGSNSQTFPHTGALVACVSSFAPQSRGALLGLLKGFLGLSGAIYSQLYLAFYGGGGDTRPLILLAGCLPAAISVAFLGTIRIIPAAAASRQPAVALARREFRAFRSFLYLSLALATCLVVAIVLQRRFRFTSAEYRLSGGAVLAMLLVVPLVIVHREEAAAAAALIDDTSEITTAGDGRQTAPSCAVNVATTEPSPPLSQAMTAEKKRANAVIGVLRRLGRRPTGPPPRGHDHTVLEALTSVDMLLLLTSSAIGVGGMLTATYNVGQIGESQGYPPGNTAAFVSLTSIWSYLGRVASGFASDAVLARRRLPTPLLLFAALLLAVPGHLLIAFGVPGALYPASIIIGFCYGATQPLTLAITSELFGLRYYSTLCTFGPAVYPVGTYLFNVRVAGRMYDREAARQEGAAAGHAAVATTCVGVRCYRESFKVVAVASAAAAAMALTLAWRTRELYAGDISVKFGGAMGEQTGMDVISENGVVEEAGEKEHVSSTTVE